MKLAKRILAGVCALTLTVGAASCGSGSSSDSSKVEVAKMNSSQAAQVDSLKSKLPNTTLKNKTIKWLSHYDINPSKGKSEDPGLKLFKEKYNGKIKYIQSTFNDRYTLLAKKVMGNDSPDFFPADDMDAFPKGAIKSMFEPIDDCIDLSSDLWKNSKTTCDAFMFNNKHYVAAIETTPCYVCVYNRTTIQSAGLDDPAKLYAENKWDWSTFTKMCTSFTDKSKDKYALDGYWYIKALNDTCGVPLISLKDGKLVNNMGDAKVAKVQDLMYNLEKQGVVYPRCDNSWKTRGDGTTGEGLGSNLTLFIPVGLWAVEDTLTTTKILGDVKAGEVMFVPMPRMDDSDTTYVSARVNGYLLCKNAPNPEGFAAYMNCLQVTNQNASNIHEEQLKSDDGWTDEMIKMRQTIYALAQKNPVYDFQEGVSAELSQLMMTVNQSTMLTGGDATTWTACVAKNKKAVDFIINEANTNISTAPTN